mmetsp:Transcript_48518/g.149766  ORF Transcript_48518/g.149766 Transcript_48518/m.149766 type:complete len:785 (-) Transcript_48518:128-2482(-)
MANYHHQPYQSEVPQHGNDSQWHAAYAAPNAPTHSGRDSTGNRVRFAPSALPRKEDTFDWPELRSAAAAGGGSPPDDGAVDLGVGSAPSGGYEMDARTSLEPVPAGANRQRRGPDLRRLEALAVPRGRKAQAADDDQESPGVGAPKPPPKARPLPKGAGGRKPAAQLAPLAPAGGRNGGGGGDHENSTPRRRVNSAPDSPAARDLPRQRDGSAGASKPSVLAPGARQRAKSGGWTGVNDASPPAKVPRVATLSNNPAKAAELDYERHKKAINARTAAVDARVHKMLAEIDRQRAKIDRVMNDQGTFEERMRQAEADRKAAAKERAERLRRRDEEHIARKQGLVAERRRNGALPPMSKGVSRFGPDPSQPVAATKLKGTSIAYGPESPQQRDGAARRSSSPHRQPAQPRSRDASPSPSPPPMRTPVPPPAGASERSHSSGGRPSPYRGGVSSPSPTGDDRSPEVAAARDRLRRAEDERRRAEEELLHAERRAAAAAFAASRRQAEALLDAPIRVIQAFMWRRRSVRAACIRVIARRRRVAEKERERRLLRDINPNYEPSDDDDDGDGAAPFAAPPRPPPRRTSYGGTDDDDDDDDDGESLEGIGLIESETTSRATFSQHASNASLRRGRRRSSVTIVGEEDSPNVVRHRKSPALPAADSDEGPHTHSPLLTPAGAELDIGSPVIELRPRDPQRLHSDEAPEPLDSSRTPVSFGHTQTLAGSTTLAGGDVPAVDSARRSAGSDDDDAEVAAARADAARLDVIGVLEGAVVCRMQDAFAAGAADAEA